MILLKKKGMLLLLSCSVLSYAMDKKVELEKDVVAECITSTEAKIYSSFAQLIRAQDKKDMQSKKEPQDKRRWLGRGFSGKNDQEVIQLQRAKL